jgi:hypothetical protein
MTLPPSAHSRQRKHTMTELEKAVRKVHAAKGRYHTQLACCDLFDLLGLPNVRPEQEVAPEKMVTPYISQAQFDKTFPDSPAPTLKELG